MLGPTSREGAFPWSSIGRHMRRMRKAATPLRCLYALKETLCSGACKSDMILVAWVRQGNQGGSSMALIP